MQITCVLLVVMLTIIGFGAQMYGFLFTMFNRPYDPIENAVYGAITRTLITLPAICTVVLFGLRRMGTYQLTDQYRSSYVFIQDKTLKN